MVLQLQKLLCLTSLFPPTLPLSPPCPLPFPLSPFPTLPSTPYPLPPLHSLPKPFLYPYPTSLLPPSLTPLPPFSPPYPPLPSHSPTPSLPSLPTPTLPSHSPHPSLSPPPYPLPFPLTPLALNPSSHILTPNSSLSLPSPQHSLIALPSLGFPYVQGSTFWMGRYWNLFGTAVSSKLNRTSFSLAGIGQGERSSQSRVSDPCACASSSSGYSRFRATDSSSRAPELEEAPVALPIYRQLLSRSRARGSSCRAPDLQTAPLALLALRARVLSHSRDSSRSSRSRARKLDLRQILSSCALLALPSRQLLSRSSPELEEAPVALPIYSSSRSELEKLLSNYRQLLSPRAPELEEAPVTLPIYRQILSSSLRSPRALPSYRQLLSRSSRPS
ncbi:hypothetical protein C7M84_008803 [Penaeus vannamei]|uniref:Uncharacterized protein n=1 Tax=Penaeus vannamei TaxID=6689 RepID=A0A3R7PP62_PENVA|nr:hypothetical protein C7M84_008803 [Penaeus vannamei]